jgi:Flp pilus assembly protein TadD
VPLGEPERRSGAHRPPGAIPAVFFFWTGWYTADEAAYRVCGPPPPGLLEIPMNRMRASIVLAATGLLLALPAVGQQWAGRGRVQGDVTDKENHPVAGATVTLKWGKDPTLGPAPLKTDKKGKWSYLGLIGGSWLITIEADGFKGSEGQANVDEFGSTPAIHVQLNKPTKEELAAAQPHNEAREALDAGNAFLQQQKWAEARAAFEKVLPDVKDADGQASILKSIAGTYLQERNAKAAIETLNKVMALTPNDAATQRLIAGALYASGDKAKAITTMQAYVETAPQDTEAIQNLVDWLVDAGREADAKTYMAKLPQGAKIDPAALLNIGIRQYNEGKLPEALQSFDRVVQENPDLSDAYYYRGLAYLGSGKMKEAKADFEKLLQMAPNGEHAADAKAFLKELK